MNSEFVSELSDLGYWPAVALEYFNSGKYSRAVELCSIRLAESPEIVSGRLILARSLYHTGQLEAAEDEFYRVLRQDPENLMALKYLGDIKFFRGDEVTALANFNRVLALDPRTEILASPRKREPSGETRVLTLHKRANISERKEPPLRQLPFVTETVGDLLLAQGHTRMAAEVFRNLAETTGDSRMTEKLESIRTMLNGREKKNVQNQG